MAVFGNLPWGGRRTSTVSIPGLAVFRLQPLVLERKIFEIFFVGKNTRMTKEIADAIERNNTRWSSLSSL